MQVHSLLKVVTQGDKVVKKPFGMLVFIDQDNEYKSCDAMLQMYKPEFWSLFCKKDVVAIEKMHG